MQIFHLTLEGPDTDFGPLQHYPVKVSIEGGDLTWPAEDINEFKELLASYFGLFLSNIRTDEEEKKDAKDLNEYLRDMGRDQSTQTT